MNIDGFIVTKRSQALGLSVFASERTIDFLSERLKANDSRIKDIKCVTVEEALPVKITIEAEEGHLWEMQVFLDGKFEPLALQDADGHSLSVDAYFPLQGFARRPHFWLKQGFSDEDLKGCIKTTVTVGIQIIGPYLVNTMVATTCDDFSFFDLPISFGMKRVIGIEYVPLPKIGKCRIIYFITKTATEKDVLAVESFLQNLPLIDDYAGRTDGTCEIVDWVIRTSFKSPSYKLTFDNRLTPVNHFIEKRLGDDIHKTTIIYEVNDRKPSTKLKDSQQAFCFTMKNERLAKTLLAYHTYFNYLRTPCSSHNYIYRIVIRTNEVDNTVQYLWVFHYERYGGQPFPDTILSQMAVHFRVFLKAVFNKLPGTMSVIKINPLSLKQDKMPVAAGQEVLDNLNMDGTDFKGEKYDLQIETQWPSIPVAPSNAVQNDSNINTAIMTAPVTEIDNQASETERPPIVPSSIAPAKTTQRPFPEVEKTAIGPETNYVSRLKKSPNVTSKTTKKRARCSDDPVVRDIAIAPLEKSCEEVVSKPFIQEQPPIEFKMKLADNLLSPEAKRPKIDITNRVIESQKEDKCPQLDLDLMLALHFKAFEQRSSQFVMKVNYMAVGDQNINSHFHFFVRKIVHHLYVLRTTNSPLETDDCFRPNHDHILHDC